MNGDHHASRKCSGSDHAEHKHDPYVVLMVALVVVSTNRRVLGREQNSARHSLLLDVPRTLGAKPRWVRVVRRNDR